MPVSVFNQYREHFNTWRSALSSVREMFWLSLLLCVSITGADLITVETSRGSVQGFDADFGNDKSQTFYGYGQMFLGIPYAKAPLKERRFTLTEDICQYNDKGEVHNATYYRPRCWQVRDGLQPADNMDEDCLYLNVYSPNVTGNYPVMFYIPGGTFTTGGGDVYHWKGAVRNLVSRGVVVVTINYRVGVIGLFTTFTDNFPPNRSMFDMLMALRWVNEEIVNFGGDISKITIFGQSAGASAVSHLSLSPMARGLFHQMIQTSGTALMEIETPEPVHGSIHKERAQQICNITDTDWGSAATDEELMECLVNAKPQELIAFDMTTSKSWMPTIDGSFLPDYPDNLAKIRPTNPLIAIDMMEEAAAPYPASILEMMASGPKTIPGMIQGLLKDQDQDSIDTLIDYAIYAYTNGKPPADNDHMGWMKVVTDVATGIFFDMLFLRDVKWQIDNNNENVWLFTLAHRSNLPFRVQLLGWMPVPHCADLPYLWFYHDIWETYPASASDFATADHFGQIWTDFAKNGKLEYASAGKERNYIEIDEQLGMKSKWRETTDDVFNQKGVELFGILPNLTFSQDGWDMLNALGPKIKNKWVTAACNGATASTEASTTSSSNIVSISSLILVSIFLTHWM
ncbi:hypothetical protein PENTCL1PPCAC_25980 [Pristionchus entomophagus]|uniref:Carboxylic ester hydrolase n=1 Tax=Pristionchus entomophagus TaxID=358040 RepID=A0AAV5UA92_9BILA|nr:hypothetical protein PENTCL1PPCAC_25980 [Pristionchus entomophagus]